ncbi:hypothetical protein PV04_10663 [Phialophora macrospora]|uniref:Enoyl reductase (ER) domain-containing protein n=1 Tax=Phialophora macrospora TaxID=1851006 RepID=A0A0D2F6C6_9EURO|nr:hypothetical protein PV04_10663 [Phialophora macrospora]
MVSARAFLVPQTGALFEEHAVELDLLRPHEVLVDLKATGICHTDVAVQRGEIPVPLPAVLGHEGAGIVRAVGSDVEDIQPGDHVVLSYSFCTTCRSCKTSKPYQCTRAQRQNFGASRPDGSQTIISTSPISTCFFGQSSFCNPTIAQETSCVVVDKSLPLEIVCALGCGFQTGAGAIYNVVKPMERQIRHVCVFGIGGVGCAAILAANQLIHSHPSAAFEIIAVDINDARLELATELGATHAVNTSREAIQDAVKRITNNEGVDAAVDCTGAVNVINECIGLLGPGGIAVTVGGPPPTTHASVNVFDLLIGCKTYTGCHQGNAYSKTFIPWLADLYSKGHLPLEKLQKTYGASNINEACRDMKEGKVVKPVLVWD